MAEPARYPAVAGGTVIDQMCALLDVAALAERWWVAVARDARCKLPAGSPASPHVRYLTRLGNMKKTSAQGSEDPVLQWVTFRLDTRPMAST